MSTTLAFPDLFAMPYGICGLLSQRTQPLVETKRQARDRRTGQSALLGVPLYAPMYVTPSRLGRLEGYAFYVGYQRSKQA